MCSLLSHTRGQVKSVPQDNLRLTSVTTQAEHDCSGVCREEHNVQIVEFLQQTDGDSGETATNLCLGFNTLCRHHRGECLLVLKGSKVKSGRGFIVVLYGA